MAHRGIGLTSPIGTISESIFFLFFFCDVITATCQRANEVAVSTSWCHICLKINFTFLLRICDAGSGGRSHRQSSVTQLSRSHSKMFWLLFLVITDPVRFERIHLRICCVSPRGLTESPSLERSWLSNIDVIDVK